jgi:hypothetical protein
MAMSLVVSRLRGKTPTGARSRVESYQRQLEVREGISNRGYDSDFGRRKRTTKLSTTSITHVNPYPGGYFTAVPQPSQWDEETYMAQKRLLEDLAKGTIIMGKPQRTENSYGVIGGHRNTVASWPPVSTHISSNCALRETNQPPRFALQSNTSGITALTSQPTSETAEPAPVGPKRLQGVEVRTYSSPLSPRLTELYASIMPSNDENQPPSTVPNEKSSSLVFGTDIPDPQLRSKREPLAVLVHGENRPAKRPGVVHIAVGIAGLGHGSGIASSPKAEMSQSKGLTRLRLKAPPVINTTLANAAFDGQLKPQFDAV